MTASLPLPLSPNDCPAGICWEHRLVLLPRSGSSKERQPVRVLPRGRLARPVKPSISGLPGASQGSDNLSGGKSGERFGEGHVGILPPKNNSAMQKITLDKCPQCGHCDDMSKTYKATIEGNGSEMTSTDLNEIKEWASQATITFMRDVTVSVVEIVETGITLTASYATGEVEVVA